MSRRRLGISDLLNDQPSPQPVPEPVVLAPHLRNPALAHHNQRQRQDADQRSLPPPRSLDSLLHPPPTDPSYLSRPSSSASLPAHSPAAYTYPVTHSPILSPLPPLPAFSSPSSPFYPPTQSSPLLHRPTSSHALPHPRIPHRSRSNTVSSLPPPPQSPQASKMALAGLEALVHAATEERKRLSAGSPSESPVFQRLTPRSPEDSYRSPSLQHQRDYPAVLPTSHAARHRPLTDELRPAEEYHARPASTTYPRPPFSLQQYEEQQQLHAQQDRQRYLEQQRLQDQERNNQLQLQRAWERQRQERQIEQQRQRDLDRETLAEQQRMENQRLMEQQLLVERLARERQHEERFRREDLRREEELRKQEELCRQEEVRRQNHEQRIREERRGEKEEHRRTEEKRFQEEQRHRAELQLEEERRQEEQRGLAEQHRREESIRFEEEKRAMVEQRRREEQRVMAEGRRAVEQMEHNREQERRRIEQVKQREEEERRIELTKQREEDKRRLEEQTRHQEELETQRLQAEHERRQEEHRQAYEARLQHGRKQWEGRYQPLIGTQDSSKEQVLHSIPPSTQMVPVVTHDAPTARSMNPIFPLNIDIPPIRPRPHIQSPRKSDHIQIKLHSPDPGFQLSVSAPPPPSVGDIRPTKKQRHSESPPPSASASDHGRVVTVPPSTDQAHLRPPLSTVRRPGSGQGRKQGHVGLGDAVEREKEKERERERLVDSQRLVSPLGRRSPPGSQIGRAKARKSDEARRVEETVTVAAMIDVPLISKPGDVVAESIASPVRSEPEIQLNERATPEPESVPSTTTLVHSDSNISYVADVVGNTLPSSAVKESPHSVTSELPLRPTVKDVTRPSWDSKSTPVRSQSQEGIIHTEQNIAPKRSRDDENKDPSVRAQENPLDWLRAQLPPVPARSLSPSTSPVVPIKQQLEQPATSTPSVAPSKTRVAPRSISPDDAALERELAELMAEDTSPQVPKREDDMDIDLAVAEALGGESNKLNIPLMEIDELDDVENELLKLVDDKPPTPPGHKAAYTLNAQNSTKPPLPLKTSVDDILPAAITSKQHTSVTVSPTVISSGVPPISTCLSPNRDSMPPPVTAPRGREKEEESAKKLENSTVISQVPKKKKDIGTKGVSKTKSAMVSLVTQPDISSKQLKAKAAQSKKLVKGTDSTPPPTATMFSGTTNAKHLKSSITNKKSATVTPVTVSRSRSTSVIPVGSIDLDLERKSEERENEDDVADDKLYCVCKTKYDGDRFMIACDRCDEWYHTACVNMPDLEVDLVDQFFCPPCIEENPHLQLKTTYKQRCLNGLRHPDPASSKACHNPARGAFSKYCSDECGVKYMQSRIDVWAKKGGKKDELWESVKHAERREGVAVCVDSKFKPNPAKKNKPSKIDREKERLEAQLSQVLKMRDEVKNSMALVEWRERLLQLASERAEHTEQCGWDQRLCFGDEEWQVFGAGVLESYDDVKSEKDMDIDEVEEGEWWCPGPKSCKRHIGWQTLRYKDICKEREKKEELLTKLTTRERQMQTRVEELCDPRDRKAHEHLPLKSSNSKLSNGHTKSKPVAEGLKKGKKRKAPAS